MRCTSCIWKKHTHRQNLRYLSEDELSVFCRTEKKPPHEAPLAICSWDTVSADTSLLWSVCLLHNSFSAKTLILCKTARFPFSASFHCLIPFLHCAHCQGHHGQRLRWRKCLCRATWEGLRKEMSKCLFTANWATDEPAAVSHESRSRREEETSMKEGER